MSPRPYEMCARINPGTPVAPPLAEPSERRHAQPISPVFRFVRARGRDRAGGMLVAAQADLSAGTVRRDHQPVCAHVPLEIRRGLRGRAARAAEPGLRGVVVAQRRGRRQQEFPAEQRHARRDRVSRRVRGRECGRLVEHRVRERGAGPLYAEEVEYVGQRRLERVRLAVAADRVERRRARQDRERDDSRRRVL